MGGAGAGAVDGVPGGNRGERSPGQEGNDQSAGDDGLDRAACALSSSRHRMITRKDAMRGSADYMKPRRDLVFSVLRRVTCGRPVN